MFTSGCSCSSRCLHRPRNSLARLRRQATSAETAHVSYPRAQSPTAARLNLTLVQAEVYARATVAGLEDAMFAESVRMDDVWFDVYGCYRDGLGWYVKVGESEDGLLVISHHAPDRPLATRQEVIYDVDPVAAAPCESKEEDGNA